MKRESRLIEYKEKITDFKKIAKTVVAFANGDGGQLIIGVRDSSLHILGLRADQIDEYMEKLPVVIADLITPPLFPQIYQKNVDGKEILVIQVYPGNQKPYFITSEGVESGVYIRVGAHTRKAPPEIIEEFKLNRQRLSYDEELMHNVKFEELKVSLLPKNMQTDAFMSSLGLFRYDTLSGEKIPTRGAILMLHSDPHLYCQEAYTIISKMAGDTGRNTIESHEVRGSLVEQSDSILAILEDWLGVYFKVKGGTYSASSHKLPLDAVREVINNALFHRSYSIAGPIKVALYNNRLEVFSPGHFAGPYIEEALGDGASYIRNKVVCLVARRLNYIEKRGTGIRLVIDKMSELNLSAPVFEEGSGWFKVTLSMESSDTLKVDSREKLILDELESCKTISSAEVAKLISTSKTTAVSELDKLINKNKIIKVGSGPRTRYKLNET